MRQFPLPLGASLPELDAPPWWNLKHKKTMYYDGRTPAASVRANMQFLMGEKTLEEFKALEPAFRDIQAYFLSLEPPRYPFPIDAARSGRGQAIFERTAPAATELMVKTGRILTRSFRSRSSARTRHGRWGSPTGSSSTTTRPGLASTIRSACSGRATKRLLWTASGRLLPTFIMDRFPRFAPCSTRPRVPGGLRVLPRRTSRITTPRMSAGSIAS